MAYIAGKLAAFAADLASKFGVATATATLGQRAAKLKDDVELSLSRQPKEKKEEKKEEAKKQDEELFEFRMDGGSNIAAQLESLALQLAVEEEKVLWHSRRCWPPGLCGP